MRMRAGSRGACEFAAIFDPLLAFVLVVLECILEASSERLYKVLRTADYTLACRTYQPRRRSGRSSATMFKYLKQVLAPSAFQPELPPELLQTINVHAARKGSFTSSGTDGSLQAEFDPLVASAFELSEMLSAGAITSVEIVEAYLHQIEQHNRRGRQLRALISVAPRHELVRIARQLDDERSRGKRRGPLHGIPIVLKDNIMTDANLGMDTTVGRSKRFQSDHFFSKLICDGQVRTLS